MKRLNFSFLVLYLPPSKNTLHFLDLRHFWLDLRGQAWYNDGNETSTKSSQIAPKNAKNAGKTMKTNQIGGVMGAVRFGPLSNPIPKLPSPTPPSMDVVVGIVGLLIGIGLYYLFMYGCK
jgi:hypothetical protein